MWQTVSPLEGMFLLLHSSVNKLISIQRELLENKISVKPPMFGLIRFAGPRPRLVI